MKNKDSESVLEMTVQADAVWDDESDEADEVLRLPRRSRRMFHQALVADTILTPAEVVQLLGGRQSVVRRWLKQNVRPLRHPSGRTVYRWGDVMNAMRGAA